MLLLKTKLGHNDWISFQTADFFRKSQFLKIIFHQIPPSIVVTARSPVVFQNRRITGRRL